MLNRMILELPSATSNGFVKGSAILELVTIPEGSVKLTNVVLCPLVLVTATNFSPTPLRST